MPMALGALIAHAGHPAEWLPFVAPILLVAVAWLVIRAREATGPETVEREPAEGDERRGERHEPPAGGEVAGRPADRDEVPDRL
ncbi:MAG: hypothetical protein ACRDK9_13225 [Solirubrobacterales bacterium]